MGRLLARDREGRLWIGGKGMFGPDYEKVAGTT